MRPCTKLLSEVYYSLRIGERKEDWTFIHSQKKNETPSFFLLVLALTPSLNNLLPIPILWSLRRQGWGVGGRNGPNNVCTYE
jgi:hypothetical protein